MPFNPNIPISTDLLSDSQGALLANNGFLNTSFGTDHYAFDDATSDNGKHKVIQMPVQAAIPVTTTDPVFFSFQQPTGNAGVLQYLCGPSGVVSSPILPLQSAATGLTLGATPATLAIFDFTGIPSNFIYSYGYVTAFVKPSLDNPYPLAALFAWDGSQGYVTNFAKPAGSALSFVFAGNILKLSNGANQTYSKIAWTLSFNRIFTPT